MASFGGQITYLPVLQYLRAIRNKPGTECKTTYSKKVPYLTAPIKPPGFYLRNL